MFEKCKVVIIVIELFMFFSLSAISTRSQGLCDLKTFRLDRITGNVVSEGPKGNEPIRNAKVELWRIGALGHEDVLVASTSTNEDGLFEMVGVKEGHYRLEVSKPNSGFVRNFAGVKLVKSPKVSEARKVIQFRLGVESLKPCGGGDVYLVGR